MRERITFFLKERQMKLFISCLSDFKTIKMVSLVNNKFVNDIVTWKISHPKVFLNLTFHRKTNGERYFACSDSSYTHNRPLFLSCEELSRVFEEVNTWINEKYISSSVTNSWGVVINGGEECDSKRLTLVFSLHNLIYVCGGD